MAKFVYVVEETTSWEDGMFTGHSDTAYETPEDAFDAMLKMIMPDKKIRRHVRWKFNTTRNRKSTNYADIEIVGKGEFASIRDEDLGEFLPGEEVIRMKEIFLKEAKE